MRLGSESDFDFEGDGEVEWEPSRPVASRTVTRNVAANNGRQ